MKSVASWDGLYNVIGVSIYVLVNMYVMYRRCRVSYIYSYMYILYISAFAYGKLSNLRTSPPNSPVGSLTALYYTTAFL
jgi:hypothetical protein